MRKQRDARIYAARRRGVTLQTIADHHNLTRERVRQICAEQDRKRRRAERPPGPLRYHELVADALNLPKRAQRALKAAGVETVDQLCEWSAEDLMRLGGIGAVALRTVELRLAEFGMSLALQSRFTDASWRAFWQGRDDIALRLAKLSAEQVALSQERQLLRERTQALKAKYVELVDGIRALHRKIKRGVIERGDEPTSSVLGELQRLLERDKVA